MTTLEGFENLESTIDVVIKGNSELSTLAPLSAWPPGVVTNRIVVGGNPKLPACAAEDFAAAQGVLCECNGNLGTCS